MITKSNELDKDHIKLKGTELYFLLKNHTYIPVMKDLKNNRIPMLYNYYSEISPK